MAGSQNRHADARSQTSSFQAMTPHVFWMGTDIRSGFARGFPAKLPKGTFWSDANSLPWWWWWWWLQDYINIFVKTHQTERPERVSFTVCKLHGNKPALKTHELPWFRETRR